MDYVVVGKVVSTHGIKGDLKIYPLTDFAKIRFKKGKVFELYNEEIDKVIKVTCFSNKTSGKFLVVHFDEIDTPEEGIKYQNYIIRMNSEELHRLPKDTYYYKDLIGSKVYLSNDELYGEVIAISSNGRQDLLRIKLLNNKETLLVFVNALIKEVDVNNKKIVLNDIEGL